MFSFPISCKLLSSLDNILMIITNVYTYSFIYMYLNLIDF